MQTTTSFEKLEILSYNVLDAPKRVSFFNAASTNWPKASCDELFTNFNKLTFFSVREVYKQRAILCDLPKSSIFSYFVDRDWRLMPWNELIRRNTSCRVIYTRFLRHKLRKTFQNGQKMLSFSHGPQQTKTWTFIHHLRIWIDSAT